MRGPSPAMPGRTGAHPLVSHDGAAAWLRRDGLPERRAARVTQGHTMNPNPRRNGPQRPQRTRRPQNGAGNARQHYERYLARAREAQLAGDEVEVENCYQHAEHYFRVMRGEGDERRD
jgi:Domain of unknown function (DUF4167)